MADTGLFQVQSFSGERQEDGRVKFTASALIPGSDEPLVVSGYTDESPELLAAFLSCQTALVALMLRKVHSLGALQGAAQAVREAVAAGKDGDYPPGIRSQILGLLDAILGGGG